MDRNIRNKTLNPVPRPILPTFVKRKNLIEVCFYYMRSIKKHFHTCHQNISVKWRNMSLIFLLVLFTLTILFRNILVLFSLSKYTVSIKL